MPISLATRQKQMETIMEHQSTAKNVMDSTSGQGYRARSLGTAHTVGGGLAAPHKDNLSKH